MKRLMRYLTVAVAVGLITVTLSLTSARPVLAQVAQPTHQAILEAISSMESSVESALSGIQDTLNALVAEAQSNVRVTPVMIIAGSSLNQRIQCVVTNVSNARRTISIQVISASASAGVLAQDSFGFDPLHTTLFALSTSEGALCKFTVTNGSRTDIRGVITSVVLASGVVISTDSVGGIAAELHRGCKSAVREGSRTDIRAALEVLASGLPISTVPAE